ncbi:MAG: prepilin-type N-terminal cleavage/methylation domain-containing protein [Phycisphaerae bacterium]|jgi:Tfp pilus assembly protein PilV
MKRILGKTAGGFTLAEAMVAVVVLCIAAAGVLMPFTAGARSRMEGQRRTLAAKLASDLVEKVIATDFNDITTAYGSYSESEGQIKDMTGDVFTDPMYAGYSRTVLCQYVYVDQESGDGDIEPIFIRCTAKVFYNGGEIASVGRLISK